jgi:transposase InsO family protein
MAKRYDRRSSESGAGSPEPGSAGSGEPARRRGDTTRRYGPAERERLLAELASSGESVTAFCARTGVGPATIFAWRKAARGGRSSAVASKGAVQRKGSREHSPETRRAAVESFARSGMTLSVFARTFGVSAATLREWLARYRAQGPKGLEPKKRGRPKGSKSAFPRIAAGVRDEIERTKRRFPTFGLKKVRDFLRRFQGVSVSTGTVRRTLVERGIASAPKLVRKKRSPPLVRRFERARPGELWQTDITSLVLPRTRTRLYLVAFLDDHSRFVVSHLLDLHQQGKLVIQALRQGIERFGKPREVLSDQGRQYFAWRGKTEFQELLRREGIAHVVARAHHPETVGKCERLWETIQRELWERIEPVDLADARERLSHWIAHYNFFRPHQGIGGLVPADRFFEVEDPLKKMLIARLSEEELARAIDPSPRKSVYLFGQVGDEQVSLVGERGEIVVQTSSGLRQRIGMDELGAPYAGRKEQIDADASERSSGGASPSEAAGPQTAEVCPSGALPARSPGAVDERHGSGAGEGAHDVHADPGDVAGPDACGGGGERARDPQAAGVAAQPAGALGDAGGTPAPAADSQRSAEGGLDGRRDRGSQLAEEAARGEGQEAGRAGRADPALDRPAEDRERVAEVGRTDDGGGENASSQERGEA